MDWELLKSLEMKQIELLTQLKNAGDETQKKQIREQLRGIDGQIQEMKEKVMKVPAQTVEEEEPEADEKEQKERLLKQVEDLKQKENQRRKMEKEKKKGQKAENGNAGTDKSRTSAVAKSQSSSTGKTITSSTGSVQTSGARTRKNAASAVSTPAKPSTPSSAPVSSSAHQAAATKLTFKDVICTILNLVGSVALVLGFAYWFGSIHRMQWFNSPLINWLPDAADSWILPLDPLWELMERYMDPNGCVGIELLILAFACRTAGQAKERSKGKKFMRFVYHMSNYIGVAFVLWHFAEQIIWRNAMFEGIYTYIVLFGICMMAGGIMGVIVGEICRLE